MSIQFNLQHIESLEHLRSKDVLAEIRHKIQAPYNHIPEGFLTYRVTIDFWEGQDYLNAGLPQLATAIIDNISKTHLLWDDVNQVEEMILTRGKRSESSKAIIRIDVTAKDELRRHKDCKLIDHIPHQKPSFQKPSGLRRK